ncbi:MAG: purine phosphoribosyltransferase family protein [Methanobrevibacter sp.]|jgi:adenine phosphoribosyltransferase|nr:purine phosphoribosyltransferase family protein [Candidatus Methanoflexus mossambicus]
MYEEIKKSLESSPIIKKGDYDYFVNPITDGIPLMYPEILEEIVEFIKQKAIKENLDLNNIDKIVCVEAMGIHLSTALSLDTRIPFTVIRKREYGLPGEVPVFQETGYSKANLYINYLEAGDKVIIVDDVVSTGGTLTAVVEALKSMDVDVEFTVAIVEKYDGKKIVEEKTGVKVMSLAKLDINDGKIYVEILD